MPNQFNSAPPDAATARRLTAIAVQVEELARARRRALTLAPVTLLVLANVTPLVIGHHRNDPDEQYTLLQLMRGAVPALPTGLFLLLGVVGLDCLGAAIAAGRSPGRPASGRSSRSDHPCWWCCSLPCSSWRRAAPGTPPT